MDWQAVTFDWNRARAFLVTAREGTFSAAARALGSTQPTVGRQVAALEDELGVLLFDRVGTHLKLTPTGVALVEHVAGMGEAALKIARVAAGQSETIEGRVAITASEVISAHLVGPVLADLRRTHPGITIDLIVSNEVRDLTRREADIAIRNVMPTSPDLVGRSLGMRRGTLYATPAYLERVGPIGGPDDLGGLEIFAFDHSDTMISGFKALGLAVSPEQFAITTSAHLVQWQLCLEGLGACAMMDEVGGRDPRVVEVLPGWAGMPVPMWLVAHREVHTSRRLRVVVDALAEALTVT